MRELLKRYHPGIVAIKYGAAAWLTDELARRFVPDDRLSAVFVALICCQPSLVAGAKRGWEQLIASLVGIATSVVLLALVPHASWTIGVSIALTYAVGQRLQWPYPTLLVALFSSLYMSLLTTLSLQGTALLRCESVALGVLSALFTNLLFAPVIRRTNLEVRVQRAFVVVQAPLASLHLAVQAADSAAVRASLSNWELSFQALGGLEDELADIQVESGWGRKPDDRLRSRSTLAGMAVRTHEQILHHAVDVGEAVARLLEQPPADGPALVSLASASLAVALTALERASNGELAKAATLASDELARVREFDRLVAAPELTEDRLGPRLIVLVGLAELHHHIGRLVHTLGRVNIGGEQP
jgi:hypothetical protein